VKALTAGRRVLGFEGAPFALQGFSIQHDGYSKTQKGMGLKGVRQFTPPCTVTYVVCFFAHSLPVDTLTNICSNGYDCLLVKHA